jgi:hypothetical protein
MGETNAVGRLEFDLRGSVTRCSEPRYVHRWRNIRILVHAGKPRHSYARSFEPFFNILLLVDRGFNKRSEELTAYRTLATEREGSVTRPRANMSVR